MNQFRQFNFNSRLLSRWAAVGASVLVALLIVCSLAPGSLAFQANVDASREARTTVARAKSRITVDGLLNEPDWLEAIPVGEILQRDPHPGEKASEKTELKLLYDDENLYIGVACYDSEPNRIIGTQMERDADLSADDRVELLIDSFHDRRNAFYFSTNPLGALVDGLIIENGQLNRNWNAIWYVRTHRSDAGWTAEFSIPFKSIGFKSGEQVWGFNFSRTIKRKLEEDRWASPRLDLRFFQVSEAGEISGLNGIHQGRGLDIRPFVSAKALHNVDTGNDTSAKAGLDVFYNITPSLKSTTTINTDFGETEVDSRQINLTRFELFFPEKRSFFLENAGVFQVGPDSDDEADVIPFFQSTNRTAEWPGGANTGRDKANGKAGALHHRRDCGANSRNGFHRCEELLCRASQARFLQAVLRRRYLHRRQSRTIVIEPHVWRRHAPIHFEVSW